MDLEEDTLDHQGVLAKAVVLACSREKGWGFWLSKPRWLRPAWAQQIADGDYRALAKKSKRLGVGYGDAGGTVWVWRWMAWGLRQGWNRVLSLIRGVQVGRALAPVKAVRRAAQGGCGLGRTCRRFTSASSSFQCC